MMQAVLLIVNLIIFLCGSAVLGGGIYMQVEMSSYLDFVSNQAVGSAIVLIVVGAVIALVSFMGCCGACTNNSCLMKSYAAILCVLLIAEIGTAVAIYVFKGEAKDIISKGMSETQVNYGQDQFKTSTQSWDTIQNTFECCGVNGFKDWSKATTLSSTQSVPDACCKDYVEACGEGQAAKSQPDSIYTEGCLEKFVNEIEGHASLAAGVGIGIGVIQLITVIVACYVGKKMGYDAEFS